VKKRKIAVLADFPLQALRDLMLPKQNRHYATWLPQIAKAWKKQKNFEIHWVILNSAVDQRMDIKQWNQVFHILPTTTCCRASTLYRKDRITIGRVLSEIKPDLVHGWGTEEVYSFAAVLSGYPNIISMQGILSHYVFKSLMPLHSYWLAALEIVVLWKAERITDESEWGKRILKKRNPFAKINVLEYGVSNIFFKTKWKPEKRKPIFLFVGTPIRRKGIQDLILAFKDKSLQTSELWVVGDGGGVWVKKQKQMSSINTKWLGFKSQREVAQLMSKAWAIILPTRADNSPNVIKEARVIGLPVITTNKGGQAGYLNDGKDGYLIAPGNIEQIRNVIRWMIKNYDKNILMGKSGKKRFREEFRAETQAEKMLELYSARKAKAKII
jgi:glycosyltransferase involved in cell wall biosynthesis